MAKHPRLILPGVALHIYQRGNDRKACFREDSDRLVYLSNLAELCKRWECALHAYCLMTNHVHLMLTPANEDGPASLIRDLGRRFVRYFNERYGRTGSLWEGRFHSCLLDSGRYVLGCQRYIDLNPVRAGMVSSPGAYRWSSYAGNSGARNDPLLTAHPEYLAISRDATLRCAAYAELCQEGEEPHFISAMRDATFGGLPLVSEELKSRLVAMGFRLERAKSGPRPELANEAQPPSLELPL
ncbi:MAG TPA: transposase [Burkholderiales bacterium]|nr:transposase [Burkholderiales bacterium]